MKKIFSNARFSHYFYSSIILLMSAYIYFSSVSIDKYVEISKAIDGDYAIIDNASSSLKMELDKETMAYRNPQTLSLQESANKIMERTNSRENDINNLVQDLENYAKKFPRFLQKTSVPSRLFFTKKILSEHEQALVNYSDSLCIRIDERDRLFFQNTFSKYSKNKNEKLNELPVNMATLELKKEKAQLKSMEISFLNYVLSKVGGNIRFDDFIVAISPNIQTPRVNEKFSADLATAAFVSDFKDREAIFTVNGETLEAKNGIARYETKCLKAGKQTIKANISIKNPFSGEVRSASKEYTFEVLPN